MNNADGLIVFLVKAVVVIILLVILYNIAMAVAA